MEEQSPVKKKGARFLRYFLLIFVLSSVAYYFISGLTYSEGTRSGILTKVSRKGVLFKTFEGELLIGGLSEGQGALSPSKVFSFSILNKDVYDKLEKYQGDKVVIHYKQVLHNFFWQGDTDYFIYDVTIVNKQ